MMAPKTKQNVGLIGLGATCAAILTVLALLARMDGYLDKRVRTITKSQIEIQNSVYYEKIEVMYINAMNVAALSNETKDIWNKALKEVAARKNNKVEVLR